MRKKAKEQPAHTLTRIEQPAAEDAAEKREPSTDSIVKAMAFLWRWRLQLFPLGLFVLIILAARDHSGDLWVTSVVVGIAAMAAASRRHGNTLLRHTERHALALGSFMTAIWSVVIWATPLEVSATTAAVLGLVLIWPTYGWCVTRWPGRVDAERAAEPEQTELMVHVLENWPELSIDGPKPLQGSEIDPDTMTEPTPGSITFAVDLARGVHCKNATSAAIVQTVEATLRLPTDTTQIEICRDNSRRINVTLTPQRHLENTAAEWDGPVIFDDGNIPLAVDASGEDAEVGLFNHSGVEHAIITGTTGVGKSNTLSSMILPGVMNDLEVVAYVDGGMGSSAPHLKPACDWWAVDGVDQWVSVINSVHAVMRARKTARAEAGLSAWRGHMESDPIVTLVIDEATTVLRELQASRKLDAADRVLEILREGRKLGVRCIQIAQDPMGADLIGGRQARSLAAGGGSMIAHRPGDGTANMLAGGSTADSVDLRTLPPGPGWCAIIRQGAVVSARARVRFASEKMVREELEGFRCRQLMGADCAAAGRSYTARNAITDTSGDTPEAAPAEALLAPVSQLRRSPVPVEVTLQKLEASTKRLKGEAPARTAAGEELSGSQRAAAQRAATNADTVRELLERSGELGLRRNAIDMELDGQMSRTTITRTLAKLAEDGVITKTENGEWKTARAAASIGESA